LWVLGGAARLFAGEGLERWGCGAARRRAPGRRAGEGAAGEGGGERGEQQCGREGAAEQRGGESGGGAGERAEGADPEPFEGEEASEGAVVQPVAARVANSVKRSRRLRKRTSATAAKPSRMVAMTAT
jgi:hypothetical protein